MGGREGEFPSLAEEVDELRLSLISGTDRALSVASVLERFRLGPRLWKKLDMACSRPPLSRSFLSWKKVKYIYNVPICFFRYCLENLLDICDAQGDS